MSEGGVSRRSALRAAAVAVIGGVAGFVSARNSSAANTKNGTTAANAYGNTPGASGQLLAALDQVPRGGGIILTKPAVVITRGADDQVHAFSAICTHQGCRVDRVADKTIDCPCHGSRFDATTGAVVSGPAPSRLPSVAVTVTAGKIYSS